MTDKKRNRFAIKTVLIFSLLPQLLRIIVDVIYSYEIAGNIAYDSWVEVAVLLISDILSKISFFSALGTVICLSSLRPLKDGASWSLLGIVIYGLSYVALYTVKDFYTVFAMFLLTAVISVYIILHFRNGDAGAIAAVLSTLIMPLFGGFAALYASNVPSVDELISVLFYFVANFSLEVILVLSSAVVSNALARKKGGYDKGPEGKIFSFKNPSMVCMAVFSLAFAVMTSVNPIVEGISFAIDNASIMTGNDWLIRVAEPIADVFILFAVGYLIMRIIYGVLERGIKSAKNG